MKRRELFKMFATLAAIPLVAPLAALCNPSRDPNAKYNLLRDSIAQRGSALNDDLFGGHALSSEDLMAAVSGGANDHWRHGPTVLNEPMGEKGWSFHYRHGIPNTLHPGTSIDCPLCADENLAHGVQS
jgi:hypothetical protein